MNVRLALVSSIIATVVIFAVLVRNDAFSCQGQKGSITVGGIMLLGGCR